MFHQYSRYRNSAFALFTFLCGIGLSNVGIRGDGGRGAVSGTPSSPQVDDQAKESARAINEFAIDLYKQLGERPGNLFYSPASISTALSMTYAGAEGETHRQIGTVLHVPGEESNWLEASGDFSRTLGSQADGYELRTANRLWGQQNFAFRPDYLERLDRNFGAPLGQVDFVRESESARQMINHWVAGETNQRIKDLIPDGVLNEMTRLVLTNAIYFKADWKSQFKKQSTTDSPFHVTTTQSTNVPLMFQKAKFRICDHKDVQVLSLPYEAGGLSMLIVLPRRVDGLRDLEQQLTKNEIDQWIARMERREVLLFLPRFKMTTEFRLKEPLGELGMSRAFSDQAEFGRISSQDTLKISEVLHKAFVEVDEKGTEAAAATGAVITVTSAVVGDEPIEFRADRPFLFLIRHESSGAILFIGRLANPE
jgi:serpin B